MVGWVVFMCNGDTLTFIFFMEICSWPTLKIWGKKSILLCCVECFKSYLEMARAFLSSHYLLPPS